MSFFGNNPQLGATSTPAKPGGIFSSFGAAATSTPNTFGGSAAMPGAFGTGAVAPNAFGTASAAPSAFGGGGVGQPNAFGTATAATGGFGGGAAAPGTFGGGSVGQPSAFGTAFAAPIGTTATSAPSMGFTGFGGGATTTATSTLPTLTGFSGFGTNPATTSASNMFGAGGTTGAFGGGFGATSTTTTAPTFGGFGTATSGTSTTGFGGMFGGGTTTSTAPSAFGGFGTQQGTFGGGGAFGSNFGKLANTTTTPGFGGFGGNTNFMLGQPQQQAPQISPDEAFAQSIFNVAIFGDERDCIVAKWNYLQALWGTGKSFYSQNAPPVEITPQNYLCRFKAMGYSRLPGKDNKMGLVAIIFNKPLGDIKAQQHQIINALNNVLGNKPHLAVNIETSKEHEEKKCQLVIYVEERSQMKPNEIKRILATDLAAFLNQPNLKPQLNNMGVVEVLALVLPDEDQLNEYLENPPRGIDPRLWRQAKLDNPDPSKYIPVPMIGFNDIKWRIKCQEHETDTHDLYLKKVGNDLSELRQRHAATTAKIMEHKRKLAELSHRILKIIVKQECTRKVGLALTPEEEALRTKLENMQALVSAPTQFKGRLSELLSQMRMQRNQYAFSGGSEYTLDKDCEDEMKSFLAMQQKAMEVLTETVTKDMKAVRIILEGMPELVRS